MLRLFLTSREQKKENKKCPEPESNQRHEDFQSSALPTELSGLVRNFLEFRQHSHLTILYLKFQAPFLIYYVKVKRTFAIRFATCS